MHKYNFITIFNSSNFMQISILFKHVPISFNKLVILHIRNHLEQQKYTNNHMIYQEKTFYYENL